MYRLCCDGAPTLHVFETREEGEENLANLLKERRMRIALRYESCPTLRDRILATFDQETWTLEPEAAQDESHVLDDALPPSPVHDDA